MEQRKHPCCPRSNVQSCGSYDPDKYTLDKVSLTVKVDESVIPGRPPCLTQKSIGMFLQPLTRELVEVPPRPTSKELPDAVIDNMVKRDKAFWVDKPGANAYSLHDAYNNYGMTTNMVLPPHQDVFPRSYQYDLDCVKYRRRHACDGMTANGKQKPRALCRDCTKLNIPGLSPFQLAWVQDPGLKRWKYYPDLTVNLSLEELRRIMMDEVGRPFQHKACTWYNRNYPSVEHKCILRKFSK